MKYFLADNPNILKQLLAVNLNILRDLPAMFAEPLGAVDETFTGADVGLAVAEVAAGAVCDEVVGVSGAIRTTTSCWYSQLVDGLLCIEPVLA